MTYSLWQLLNMWRWLYKHARKKNIYLMIELARRMEGWSPTEFLCRPEINPPRLIISFDGQPEIILSKEELHKMFKKPILMLRWVRKHSYGEGMYK